VFKLTAMKKRTLYLLRHGSADVAGPNGDIERPLKSKGKADIEYLSEVLIKQGISWDLSFCSNALRANSTFQIIDKVIPEATSIINDCLYGSSADEVMLLLQSQKDSVCSILLVGHNPCLQSLGLILAASGGEKYARFAKNFPPGSFLSLDLSINKWSEISPRVGYINHLLVPGDF
tara:strand:- start:39483 stop:40010 length:528 start_codon:yes stop_codon:yes gene_type:complete